MIVWLISGLLLQAADPNFTSSLLDRAYVLGYADVGYKNKGKEKSNFVLYQKEGHQMAPLLAWTNPETGDHLSYFARYRHLIRHPETGQIAFIGVHRVLNGGQYGLYTLDTDGTLTLYGKLEPERAQFKKGTPEEVSALERHADSILTAWDFTDPAVETAQIMAMPSAVSEAGPVDHEIWSKAMNGIYLTLVWAEEPNALVLFTNSEMIKVNTVDKTAVVFDLRDYRRHTRLDDTLNFLRLSVPTRHGDSVFLYTKSEVYRVGWDGQVENLVAHRSQWKDPFTAIDNGTYFAIGKKIYDGAGELALKLPKRKTAFDLNSDSGLCVYAKKVKRVAGMNLVTGDQLFEQKIKGFVYGLSLSNDAKRLFVLSSPQYNDDTLSRARMEQFEITPGGLEPRGKPHLATGVFPSSVGAFFKTKKALRCMDPQGNTCQADLPLVNDMKFAVLVDGEVLFSDIPFTNEARIAAIRAQHFMFQQHMFNDMWFFHEQAQQAAERAIQTMPPARNLDYQ